MKNLFEFIGASTTPYHAAECASDILASEGFCELSLRDSWQLKNGGRYFVRRGGAVIAFIYDDNAVGFSVVASHSDFPALIVKGDKRLGSYLKFSVEKYGGMIGYTWLDRSLAVSGRVMVSEGGSVVARLVRLDFNVVIPSVAIHLQRGVNEGFSPKLSVDMLPLASIFEDRELYAELSLALGVERDDILSFELWLSSAEVPTELGIGGGILLSPRLDNLASAYTTLRGLCRSKPLGNIPIYALFNNEEVGSETSEGAASTLLADVMYRIAGDTEKLIRMQASSFTVSVDNAHAKHPNHPELSDAENAPMLGRGIAVKHNAARRYATDVYSEARLRQIARGAGIPLQDYYNNPDIAGGSTLGAILTTKVSLPTVDIGIPQLAMHSICETAALSDIFDMERLACAVFSIDTASKSKETAT